MKLYVATENPNNPEFAITLEVLQEIVRVAIEQKSIEWPMSCYEQAQRLQKWLKYVKP